MESKKLNQELDKIINKEIFGKQKDRKLTDAVLRKYEKSRAGRNIESKKEFISMYNDLEHKITQQDFSEKKKQAKNPMNNLPNAVNISEKMHGNGKNRIVNFTFPKTSFASIIKKDVLPYMKNHRGNKFFIASKTDLGWRNFGQKALDYDELDDRLNEILEGDGSEYWLKVVSENHSTTAITLVQTF